MLPKQSVSTFSSFDGTERARARWFRPDRYRDLEGIMAADQMFIPRGAGLSHAAASFDAEAAALDNRFFNRVLSFDAQAGSVTVETGMRLGRLLSIAVERGWYPPVLPGHPAISVGGSIAFNVHGKSQFKTGNFGDWVKRIWLMHPSVGEVECSPTKNAELFGLTLGGMGLTGYISKAELQLVKLPGRSIEVTRHRAANLLEAVSLMESLSAQFPIVYSWNNLNLRGRDFGRGFVYAERFVQEGEEETKEFNDFEPPQRKMDRLGLFNGLTTSLVCRAYEVVDRLKAESRVTGLKAGSFPLNGKEIYFRLFGPKGFRECQCIVARDRLDKFVAMTESIIKRTGAPVALGSLKLFKGQTTGLNFCADGVCLAMDIPIGPWVGQLFPLLDDMMLELRGIVNLSKDSRAPADLVSRLFPEYESFRSRLREFDPKALCQSRLRRRLAL